MDEDVVTRLRHMAWAADEGEPFAAAAREAADEIERLRAEANSMASAQAGWASAQAGWGRVARLNDEIERLRAERDELLASGNQLHAWITANATCASLAATPGATILYAIHHAYHPVPEDVAGLLAAWEEARCG